MSWPTLTAFVVLVAVVLVILYDLLAFTAAGDRATISRLFLELATASPGWVFLLGLVVGVLCGHLFFPQHPSR